MEKVIFSCGIEDFMAERYQIDWEDEALVYSCSELGGFLYETKYHISPEESDWSALIEFLENCDWKEKYSKPGQYSGTDWYLHFEKDGKELHVEGAHAFPEDFSRFKDLLEKCLKGRKFGQ